VICRYDKHFVSRRYGSRTHRDRIAAVIDLGSIHRDGDIVHAFVGIAAAMIAFGTYIQARAFGRAGDVVAPDTPSMRGGIVALCGFVLAYGLLFSGMWLPMVCGGK
jgi:hypothetical protein